MPRLMEKEDWIQTMADVGSADRIWCENVVGDNYGMSVSLPESGRYRVIFVKLDDDSRQQDVSCGDVLGNISPKVRALRGAARPDGGRDYKDVLADVLSERYEALR